MTEQKRLSLPELVVLPCLDGFMCWTVIMWVLITAILGFHVYLMARGLTTKEFLGGGEKFSYLDVKGVNLYCRGSALENILYR